jgi:small subunit ribosomal protein S21
MEPDVSRVYADSCRVYVYGPDDFEGAVRRFTKVVREAGVLTEVKRREAYEPPSVARRRKAKKARARRARAARRERTVDWKPTA